ncbi:hypothetical protein F0344_20020 [Streptomyces finlayi]|uniref:Uncharacterized protein n=1 Tax=Streptomyces finlayi TaxID=67296 RepID=A0A7G7BMP3_9ACTN|nr:hypothetical protein [Streptomyces finlayi]QNE76608.1 hypothetical protein F0344_20020 [Streptomyces finlayi]
MSPCDIVNPWTTPPAGGSARGHDLGGTGPGSFEHLRLGAAQALFGGLDTVRIGKPDREVLGESGQWWGRDIGTGPEHVGEGLGRHIAQMISVHGAETGRPGILSDLPPGPLSCLAVRLAPSCPPWHRAR